MSLSMIVAADLDDCIGRGNELPWRIPTDMKRFRELTTGHVCILGARTQQSILDRGRGPLKNRISVVVTRWPLSPQTPASVIPVPTPETALTTAQSIETFSGRDEVFLLGGARLYRTLLPHVDKVYLTRVDTHSKGEVVMPSDWLDDFAITRSGAYIKTDDDEHFCRFEIYERVRPRDALLSG